MLTRKDWLYSFMSNLIFVIILLIVMYYSGLLFSVEKKEFVIELASQENLPVNRQSKGINEEISFSASIPEKSESLDLPQSEAPSFRPRENALSIKSEEMEWTEHRAEIPEMPDDPMMNQDVAFFMDDPLLEEVGADQISSSETQSWSFSWEDGRERQIQYIPPWDYYVNRELSQQLDRCRITFSISSEGYVSNVKVEESLFMNEAWFTLLENWLSRIVFEPGYEGKGSLTLIFGNNI